MTKIEKLVLRRATEILESGWYEDQGEIQEEYGLSDEEMEEFNNIPYKVVLV